MKNPKSTLAILAIEFLREAAPQVENRARPRGMPPAWIVHSKGKPKPPSKTDRTKIKAARKQNSSR